MRAYTRVKNKLIPMHFIDLRPGDRFIYRDSIYTAISGPELRQDRERVEYEVTVLTESGNRSWISNEIYKDGGDGDYDDLVIVVGNIRPPVKARPRLVRKVR